MRYLLTLPVRFGRTRRAVKTIRRIDDMAYCVTARLAGLARSHPGRELTGTKKKALKLKQGKGTATRQRSQVAKTASNKVRRSRDFKKSV